MIERIFYRYVKRRESIAQIHKRLLADQIQRRRLMESLRKVHQQSAAKARKRWRRRRQ